MDRSTARTNGDRMVRTRVRVHVGVCVGSGTNGPYDIFCYNLTTSTILHQRV